MQINRRFFSYDILFLSLLLCIGIFTTFSYGVNLDQDSEQDILFSNLKEYMLLFHAEDTQTFQDMTVHGITEISQSVEKDHGIAPYYVIGFIWHINQISPYAGNVLWHLYTFLLVFAGICALYLLSKKLYNSTNLATITTLLFFFTPKIFAESHYNNKDMVLLSLLLLLFYQGWCIINHPSWKYIFFFSITGAFAFNIKIIGAYFFGFIGLYLLFHFIAQKKFDKLLLLKCLSCIFIWIISFIVITPASWKSFIEYIQYAFKYAVNFERWSNYILFGGKLIHTQYTGIPAKYLPTMILITTPVCILILWILGSLFLILNSYKKRFQNILQIEGYLLATSITGLLPLAYAILTETSVYNGWRHFYFSYASIILLVGYGIYEISKILSNKVNLTFFVGIAYSYIAFLIITLFMNHPYEYCYYNFLAGKNVETKYEMDYWDVSIWQALQLILTDSSHEQITVGAFNIFTYWGLANNQTALPQQAHERIVITEDWKQAEYIIVNSTYTLIYSQEEYLSIQENYELVKSFTSYGNTICEIYRQK